jgi:hypothetical protein
LVNPKTGDVIENISFQKMFGGGDLDDRGELPGPFCIEKHNFNAHWIMGDFDYTEDGRPKVLKNNQGMLVDKRGRPVNQNGWYVMPG